MRFLRQRWFAVMLLLAGLLVVSGCGSSSNSGLQRIMGLSAEGVVNTFFSAVKNNRLAEAGLYVSKASTGDAQTVAQFLGGNGGLDALKQSNLVAVRQVAVQGDYAVVLATLQPQNTLQVTIKPVALERTNGEWYIVDTAQIYRDAKYKILQQLLATL